MAMISAKKRQAVYDKLGLRSWEVAEREAEYRRTAKQREMVERAERFGEPEETTLGREFTLPSGVKKTYTEGGEQTALTVPSYMTEPERYTPRSRGQIELLHRIRSGTASGEISNYKEQYSPKDQKRIERLLNDRSDFSVDPDVTEEEKQRALDVIDAEISKIPRLSPMMREPTAQQKYEASIVTDPVTGQRGIVGKDGTLKPLIDTKIQQTQQDQYEKTFQSALDKELGAAEDIAEKGDAVPYTTSVRRARRFADTVHERLPERPTTILPELDELWTETMNILDWKGWNGKRAKTKDMPDTRERYVNNARDIYGFTAEEALYDWTLRRQNSMSDPDDPFNFLFPETMTEQERQESSRIISDYIKAGSTHIAGMPDEAFLPQRAETIEGQGLRVGEGRVTGEGGTTRVYKGIVVGPDEIIVRKGGKEYKLPAIQREEAIKEGYEVVE